VVGWKREQGGVGGRRLEISNVGCVCSLRGVIWALDEEEYEVGRNQVSSALARRGADEKMDRLKPGCLIEVEGA
jgi:hypothetical protein